MRKRLKEYLKTITDKEIVSSESPLANIKEKSRFYRDYFSTGAGDGNRTHVASLEGWSSTIELHLH